MPSDEDGAIYIANTTNKTAAPTAPMAMLLRDPAPVNAMGDVLGVLVMVAFETPTELKVVAAGPLVVMPPAWEASVVAATRAAAVVVAPDTVVNCT